MKFTMTPEDARRWAEEEGDYVIRAGNKTLAQVIVSVYGPRPQEKTTAPEETKIPKEES
jgi:hypothetical protein